METEDIRLRPAENTAAEENTLIDTELIIEQIWNDLGQTITRSEIKRALIEVAPVYEGARVKTFVPIFLRRDVQRRLKGELEQNPAAKLPTPEITTSGEGD